MRIKLIFDLWAGRGTGRRFLSQVKKILGRGNLLDVSLTKGPGEALLLAQEAAKKDHDIIVAGCGDGMLNEIINGILRVRSDLPLGFIPLGMSNTAAWGLGLPQDVSKACRVILQKKIKRIDLGKIIRPVPHYFLSMFDFGYGAALVHQGESSFRLKQLFGKLCYILCAYPVAFKYKFPELQVKIDDGVHKGYAVLVSNSGFYMGKHRIAPQVEIDDGYLDVCVFKKSGTLNMSQYFFSGLMLNKLHDFPGVEFYRARKMSINSPEKVPGQIDGNPFGFTPVEIEVAPQILPVLVP